VAYYARLGITVQRLLTDNGSAFRSREFKAACIDLGIKHRFTRPCRPQTNGKNSRFADRPSPTPDLRLGSANESILARYDRARPPS
jgi:transposase InsO family protein